MPFFSIILPTYNRAKILANTIQRVLDQEFDDFELWVIDDGSTDGTREVIGSFQDDRLHYHFKKNEERAVARNKGIDLVTGAYVTFVDSDDQVYTNYLSSAYQLCKDQEHPWLHVNYEIRDQEGNLIKKAPDRKGNLGKQLITGNHLSCLGIFVKKEILAEERFDEATVLIGSEDYDLWLRLAQKYPLSFSNEPVAAIIQHQDRSVMGFSKEKLTDRIMYLVNKHRESGIFSGKEFRIFKAHRYLYLSLHLLMSGITKGSLYYLAKALMLKPDLILSVKALVIFKKVLNKPFDNR